MNTSISARLRDYRMLWRAAVTHANPRPSGIIRWGGAFIVIAMGAALVASRGPRAALVWFWCAVSVILLMNWGWRFMPGAVKLNTPENARLVPQMRRRLIELSCLVCLLGIAGIASAPYNDASHLGGWLFLIVILTMGTGLATAGHWAGSAIVVSGFFASVVVGELPGLMGAMLSHPLAVVLALPVYACLVAVAVQAMFPEAGERHWNMLARRSRWAAAAGNRDPLVERMATVYTKGWYAASLRRDSARRDGRRLLLHALGPVHHLGDTAIAIGLMTAMLAVLGLFVTWSVDPDVVGGIGWLFASLLLFVPLSHSVRLSQMGGNHTDEQALARLAPAAPASSAAFNEQLGRTLVLQVLSGWLLATGVALLLAALGGADGTALLRLASICCLLLPMLAFPLRDHALRSHRYALVAIVLLLAWVAAGIVIGLAAGALAGLPLLPVAAAASIACAAAAVVRGLRTMRHAPCAFPAGRMD